MRLRQVSFAAIKRILKQIDQQPGYWLITGTWSRYTPGNRQHWTASHVRYCPDERQLIQLAAKIAGPVLLIEGGTYAD